MRVLLDTHALIWWAIDDPKLSRRVRTALGGPGNDVFVSAASAWEIATKARLGKLHWSSEAGTIDNYVRDQGFEPLAVTLEHAERAGALGHLTRRRGLKLPVSAERGLICPPARCGLGGRKPVAREMPRRSPQ